MAALPPPYARWESLVHVAVAAAPNRVTPSMEVDESVVARYAYRSPDTAHERLFHELSAPNSPRSSAHSHRYAGWFASERVDCPPVFIAHDLQGAIWLLQKSLPEGTLPAESWERLSHASFPYASSSEEEEEEEEEGAPPTSAQLLRRHQSISTDTSEERPAKRAKTKRDSKDAEPAPITTVTTKNREAEMRRVKRLTANADRHKAELGLVRPDAKAPKAEEAAYASVQKQDAPTLSWVFKQPVRDTDFFHATVTPYATAVPMVEKAKALGNPTSLRHAASFLQNWRRTGSPFPNGRTSASPTLHSAPPRERITQGDSTSTGQVGFARIWDAITCCEAQLATVHVQYRWAMAAFAQAYEQKTAEIHEQDQRLSRSQRSGLGQARTRAKKALMDWAPVATTLGAFAQRLKRAMRWYKMAEKLGWGSLCLLPYDVVSNYWVEQALSGAEWDIWIGVAQRTNPDAIAAGRELDAWLGAECIAGGSIAEREMLRIEADVSGRVEEVMGGEDSEEGNERHLLTQETAYSTERRDTPERTFRQMTLHELFKPQAASSDYA